MVNRTMPSEYDTVPSQSTDLTYRRSWVLTAWEIQYVVLLTILFFALGRGA